MADITFDKSSTQISQQAGVKPVLVNANEDGGRVRVKKFSFTATGAVVSGSQIELLRFAKEVRIIGGAITSISLSNSATADIGYTETAAPTDATKDVFVDGVTAASVFEPFQVLTAAETSLFLTTGVGALVAADAVEGYVLYVANT